MESRIINIEKDIEHKRIDNEVTMVSNKASTSSIGYNNSSRETILLTIEQF